jgi:REP element-mobilizing transposase RayT
MARPKHRTKPGETYFVTTDTWERRKVFLKATAAEIVEARLFEYRDKGCYCVHHYVVMPEHFHALLTPGTTTSLERAVGLFKGRSSHDIGRALQMRFPVWHEGFTEHEIRDKEDYETHVRYIQSNPVKAGLVREPRDYPYCSLNGKYRLDSWPVASGAKAP